MTNTHGLAVIVAGLALSMQIAAYGAQTPQSQPHQPEPATTQPPTDITVKCKAMMAEHEKMMTDMKAADQRLDDLVAKMTAASGQAKTEATAEVVREMVSQRKTMRDNMMKMHQAMMSHMMEHMQAGPHSMATCPMMKMGTMKH